MNIRMSTVLILVVSIALLASLVSSEAQFQPTRTGEWTGEPPFRLGETGEVGTPRWMTAEQGITSAAAQNVELVSQIGGVTNAVAVQDDHAYIGVGPRLVILDVSDLAHPAVVGQTDGLPGLVEGIAVRGNTVYLAAGRAGLRVIDVSNPAAPVEIGFYNTPGWTEDVVVVGNYAYVAADDLHILDISNPAVPSEVGFCDTPGAVGDVVVAGDYAYVAAGGLRIIDVSNPALPVEVGYTEGGGSVAVAGNYAYLTVVGYPDDGYLRIVDVSDPTAPSQVSLYNISGHVRNVAIVGNYAYVVAWGEGLRIIDVSDPAHPTEVGSYPYTGIWPEDVVVVGNTAYVAASEDGLRLIDISDPTHPTETGFHTETPVRAADVVVAGNYAYIVDVYWGLPIIDVSDPAHPIGAGNAGGGTAYSVAVAQDYTYVTASNGLRITDVSDPAHPTQVGFYDTGVARSVAVAGNYVYVIDDGTWDGNQYVGSGLHIIDVSDPAAPSEVGFYETTSRSAWDVAVVGNYAYIADYGLWDGSQYVGGGLRIVDVSNPNIPSESSFYDMERHVICVAVVGNYAYINDDTGIWDGHHCIGCGLRIINVSNPAAPSEVGFYETTPGLIWDVAVAGSYAYAANNYDLDIVDISNPAAPSKVGFYVYDTSRVGYYNIWAHGVAVVGNTVYVAAGHGGLFILRFTPPPTDAHEPDDLCAQAQPTSTDGTLQVHTFHDQADTDWVTFDAISGVTYLIQAQIPAGSPADVVLEIHDQCTAPPVGGQDYTFSPGVRVEFQAPADGLFYLKLLNHNPAVYGEDVSYHLSVRALDDAPTPGAVVIVAGKHHNGDPVQSNIHNVTNAVYRLFQAQGYDGERIHYLATDLTLDPDGDGTPDVDGLPTPANLEQAITQWALDKVGPNRPLTLYLMDHGGYDVFYLNGPAQTLNPSELDGWLDALEGAAPGTPVNVIVEACHAGSFIDLAQTVSAPGRLVIASTGAQNLAWASTSGAAFSDPFLQALGEGASLYGSFQEAQWAVQIAHPDQTPWLDSDGDGTPNEGEDALEAAQRGFAYAGTLGGWSPYVVWAAIEDVQGSQGTIEAEVRDDQGVSRVWAVVYPPLYQAPDPGATGTLVLESLATVELADKDGDGVYSAAYDGFDEAGAYRVVVYAQDGEGLVGRPQGTEVHRLYLPLVAHNYSPPATFPLHVGAAIPAQAVGEQGEVFYSASLQMPETLPPGGRFYFSSQQEALAEVLVDDELVVLLDEVEVFVYRFSDEGVPPAAAIVEVQRATLEWLAGQTVTVEYRDVYGVLAEASAMWLIWMP